jgi:hypothetical protein
MYPHVILLGHEKYLVPLTPLGMRYLNTVGAAPRRGRPIRLNLVRLSQLIRLLAGEGGGLELELKARRFAINLKPSRLEVEMAWERDEGWKMHIH